MKKQLASTSMKSDRLSYLWLIVAVVFSLFATGRWVIPLAAWLAPIFLLRFVRTQQAVRGILLASLVNVVAVAFAFQGAIPIPGLLYYLFALGVGLYATLPYVADRLIANRLHGFVATLVFPLTWATFEYLNSLFNPYGSWGSLAYTQYGNLPLMQLVSVTGLWGISFLIAWLASVVNWAWERDFAWPKVHAGGLLYASILSLVLLFGGARLILFPPQADSVRVAGVSPSRSVSAEFDKQMPASKLSVLLSSKATETDRQVARQAFAKVNEDLLTLSQQTAQAGSKIVLWPEPVLVLQEDESALIARASTLAQQEGIYLDMGLIVFTHQSPFAEDKTMLVDPTGKGHLALLQGASCSRRALAARRWQGAHSRYAVWPSVQCDLFRC
jgi:apolipoprotein N-acyltransferase